MYEAFKIGVSIGLINNASLGLAALSKDFSKAEAQASLLQKRIDALQNLGKIGSSMMSFSSSINVMLKAPYEAAKASELQRQKITASKLPPATHARIYPQAHTLAQSKTGSTSSDNTGFIGTLLSALGNLPQALQLSGKHQKSSRAAPVKNHGKSVEGRAGNAAKAKGKRGAHSAGKAYASFDPESLYAKFAAYIQAKSTSVVGTHATAYMGSMVKSHMGKRGSGTRSGASPLINRAQEYSQHTKSKQKRNTANGVLAHAAKTPKGAKGQAAAPRQNFLTAINGLPVPAITAGLQQFSDALTSLAPIVAKHPALVKALAYSLTTLQAAMTIGENVMNAISMFNELAGILGEISSGASKLTKIGEIGAGVAKLASSFSLVGRGLTVLRSVASIVSVALEVLAIAGRALFATPIGLVIMAIAAAAYLLWRNWGTIGPMLSATWDKIKNGFESFVGGISSIWNKLTSLLPSWMHHDDTAKSPTLSDAAPPVTAHDAAVTRAASKGKSLLPAGLQHSKATPLSAHAAAKQTAATTPVPAASATTPQQSQYVRGAAQQAILVDAKLYLTRTGQTEIARSTAQIISTGIARPMGSGTFDTGLHALTPAMA